MTELLTAAQMRANEQAAIASGHVTGLELMERAGRGVVSAMFDHWWRLRQTPHRAVILCGPGNNGGDGYVVARLLHQMRWDVRVLALGSPERLPPDAHTNCRRWTEIGEVLPLTTEAFRAVQADAPTHIYIDAVFGTGVSRPVSGEAQEVLTALCADPSKVVAIDAPSGLCLDSGRLLGHPEGYGGAGFASLTVTFDAPKVGHFLAQGPDLCGHLAVADIGIRPWREMTHPRQVGDRWTGAVRRPDTVLVSDTGMVADARAFTGPVILPTKGGAQTHKYSYGHTLVLSGGAGRTGAARLAARAALRVGSGLVTMAVQGPAMSEVAAQITAIMLREVSDDRALTDVLEDERINALCLGPGLGLGAPQVALVREALAARRPTVLDADALTLIAQNDDLRAALHDQCILTPHGGEFARLFPGVEAAWSAPRAPKPSGDAATDLVQMTHYHAALAEQAGPAPSKIDAVRAAAREAGCTVLLKGPDTVIATPEGRTGVHAAAYDRAAPMLATAGSGDVLAGLIAGGLAMGLPVYDAACAGAWLHVECARQIGQGLIAEDLPEVLPAVLARAAERAGG